MAATCPNRTRHKRVHSGGGQPGCKGKLEAILSVPVVLPIKSMRDPFSVERTLPSRPLKHGVRVKAETIRATFQTPALRDVICPKCKWTLSRSLAAVRRSKRAV